MSGIHGGRAWSGWPEKQAALAAASLVASLAKAAALLLLVTYFCAAGMPQDEAPASGARVFTLKEAVNFALANYPAVKAAEEQIAAAQGGVALARTGYLPRVDALWQSNRATRNNVFGLLLPQSVISPISGPVLTSISMGSVWGSAGGVLFSWEPLDFGYRHATVKAAQAAESQASAEAGLTRLGVAAKAAAAFLNLLAAGQRCALRAGGRGTA